MRVPVPYHVVCFVAASCLLLGISAVADLQRRAGNDGLAAGPSSQILAKGSPINLQRFNPDGLGMVPEDRDVTRFKTKAEIESEAQAARIRALLHDEEDKGSGGSAVQEAERTPQNELINQRANWLQRLSNKWKSRFGARNRPLVPDEPVVRSSSPAGQAVSPINDVHGSLSPAPRRFAAEEIQEYVNEVTYAREVFDFAAVRYAPRTDATNIPVLRVSSLDDGVLSAARYNDGTRKLEPVYLAFDNGQIFKKVPTSKGFQVRPVEDALTLSRIQTALSKPIVRPPPRRPRVTRPVPTTDWNPPSDSRSPVHDFVPASAPRVPSVPLSDEDKIKQAFEQHDDQRIARFFNVKGLINAPKTADRIPVIKYKDLNDPVINAFAFLDRQSLKAYLVGPDGKVAFVQRAANDAINVQMIRSRDEIARINNVLKRYADSQKAANTLAKLGPGRVTGNDLYTPLGGATPDLAGPPNEIRAGPDATRSSWWTSISKNARNLLDKFKPTLKYAGHAD